MSKIAVLVAALALAACGGDDGGDTTVDAPVGPRCGDGTCNGVETNQTCSQDCPVTGPRCGDGTCNGNETNATCAQDCPVAACTADAASCSGETICLSSACVAAFPRVYQFVVQAATLPTTAPGGGTWDVGAGAPDPFVEVRLNAVLIGTSPAVQDTFAPVWSYLTPSATVPAGSTLRIDVFDEDVTTHDGAFVCSFPLTADFLHGGMSGRARFAVDHREHAVETEIA